MSREVSRLLLDMNSYGGTGPLGKFPLLLKRIADILAPRLAVVFRRLQLEVTFMFAGEWRRSPQFQRVHLPPQWSITDQFP